MTRSRGVVVVAHGRSRYHRQARTLAQSLQRYSPNVHRSLITDRPRSAAADMFDGVVAIPTGQAEDCRLKLRLDLLAPYERTLYLDADSIVVAPVEPLFEMFDNSDVGVIGRDLAAECGLHWYGDVASMCRLAGSGWLPKCNSGVIMLRSSARTSRVFARARHLAEAYSELGLDTFRGGIADEPLLAMALAEEGIHAQELTSVAAATPIGITGPLHIDVLSGRSGFFKNGRWVAPMVLHFAADFSAERGIAGSHYRRERCKLRLTERHGWPDYVGRLAAGLRYGLECAAFNLWIRLAGRAPRDPASTRPRGRTR